MEIDTSSPPISRTSTPSSRGPKTPLSLDLSSLPPLVAPKPASNTLLVTNLLDLDIFRPDHLQTIRESVDKTARIHSWSPLKSFRRIVVSFYDIESAIKIRQLLDGEYIMGDRTRVYFGEPTPIEPVDQHLHAPASDKMFFISPPPSPPHGWEMRNEGPPNKEVHADDLVSALSKLHARAQPDPLTPITPTHDGTSRNRSGSATMIYAPDVHGSSPDLPTIAVEDLTDDSSSFEIVNSPDEMTPESGSRVNSFPHTARPPIELMSDA
ncbi:MAG: hypothetical protein M1825_001138 [Sarcosagium campestre]|nr:MAG: hypothetical protein M1825_001138 [Sarcosagium campestre]